MRRLIGMVGILLLSWSHSGMAGEARIAAASSLTHALRDIAAQFEQETGDRIKLSFGSSGNLTRQIQQGAPFELFFSADPSYIARLTGMGLTQGDAKEYAKGRLVLYRYQDQENRTALSLQQLQQEPEHLDGVKRFAMANVDHAPYGKIARQALEKANLWAAVEARLVIGENAAQTTQFAMTGAVDMALIPYSMAINRKVSARGSYQLVDASFYTPLSQQMVLTKRAGVVAEAFYAYVVSDPAQKIFARYGLGS